MKECEIEEKRSFKRSLKKLPEDIKERIAEAIDIIKENPFSGRPLKGRLKKLWRYRVGKFRIVYLPYCRVLLITIGHRETVYS